MSAVKGGEKRNPSYEAYVHTHTACCMQWKHLTFNKDVENEIYSQS